MTLAPLKQVAKALGKLENPNATRGNSRDSERASAAIEALRAGAEKRLEAMGDGHNEPSWDCFSASEVIDAVLGTQSETEK